jgi:hypothetical protein
MPKIEYEYETEYDANDTYVIGLIKSMDLG